MTISTTQSSVTYVGNGVTTLFPFAFLIPDASEAVVTLTNISVSPNVAIVLPPSAYTLSGAGNTAGGTVLYPIAGSPITSDYTLTIARVLPLTQNISISNQGNFYPEAIEDALDYSMMCIQQLETQILTPPLGANGGLLRVTMFVATGTWNIGANTTSLIVQAQAPGAGSGGTGNIGLGQASASGGASGGNWGQIWLPTAPLTAAITINPAGLAGTTTTNGTDGGTVSFAGLLVLLGGIHSVVGVPGSGPQFFIGAPSPAASGGGQIADIIVQGRNGKDGLRVSGSTTITAGDGGDAILGTGGNATALNAAANGPAAPGTGFGGGASGSVSNQQNGQQPGASGAPGCVLVYEYGFSPPS